MANSVADKPNLPLTASNPPPTPSGSPTMTANANQSINRCASQNPWHAGAASKRVDCLNNAWVDYMPEAKPYVDEFKSYRLNLAKEVDAGKIDSEEYSELEQEGLDKLVAKTAYLNRALAYAHPPVNSRADNATVATPVPEVSRTQNQVAAASSVASQNRQGQTTSSSASTVKAPPSPTQAREPNPTYTHQVVSDSGSLAKTIGEGLEAILGTTLRLAIASAPIITSILVQRNVAAWNAYYANQYNRPRMMTCTPLSNGLSNCF